VLAKANRLTVEESHTVAATGIVLAQVHEDMQADNTLRLEAKDSIHRHQLRYWDPHNEPVLAPTRHSENPENGVTTNLTAVVTR
jgi:hypothetical protein